MFKVYKTISNVNQIFDQLNENYESEKKDKPNKNVLVTKDEQCKIDFICFVVVVVVYIIL